MNNRQAYAAERDKRNTLLALHLRVLNPSSAILEPFGMRQTAFAQRLNNQVSSSSPSDGIGHDIA